MVELEVLGRETSRPRFEQLLAALEISLHESQAHRTHMWVWRLNMKKEAGSFQLIL